MNYVKRKKSEGPSHSPSPHSHLEFMKSDVFSGCNYKFY